MTIRLRRLGRSDIEVSPIGLGCWQFSKAKNWVGKFWPALPQSVIEQVVATSLQCGVTWFDTAEIYGGGESERALAQALRSQNVPPRSVAIATKWWPTGRTARSITQTIGERVNCLAPYPIDLYQIHQPLSLSSVREQMKAMAQLTRDGKIRQVGVSNFSASKMVKAHKALADFGLQLASNQMKYSMLDRRIEQNGVMDAAKELGISVIAYSPLEQGLLTGRFHETTAPSVTGMRKLSGRFKPSALAKSAILIAELRAVAAVHGATPAQVALAWLLQAHGDMVLAIPGASNSRQAQSNAEAMHIELTQAQIDTLSTVSQKISR
ncbi:MAG: aldo/keto reductase [Firmicutes bacterium]|nr:aldo/keto reductase [Bacillota bacterium]